MSLSGNSGGTRPDIEGQMRIIPRSTGALDRFKARPRVALILAIYARQREDGVRHLSAAVTYYLFLSVFPALILGLSALGYYLNRQGLDEVQRMVNDLVGDIPGMGPILERNLESIEDLWPSLGLIALVGILWTGSGGVNAVRDSLLRIFRERTQGNIAVNRGRALLVIAVGAPLLLVSIGATVWATSSGEGRGRAVSWVITIAASLAALALNTFAFGIVYRMLVPDSVAAPSDHWPGALLSGVALTALTLLGSAYTQRVVVGATAIWGALAGLIGALIILNLGAKAFLYGAELTAFRLEQRTERGSRST